MYSVENKIRVRYAETDRMGYVYYGNYAQYFEVARVEMLRELGISYKNLEDSGVILPVLNYTIKYLKPAFYDDLLTIKTTLKELPKTRISFSYETYNENNILLNLSETTLVFIDKNSGKPRIAPESLLQSLHKYFVL
jgi:acyl-CoA thioester hydrolase